jgi:hypothetical protein
MVTVAHRLGFDVCQFLMENPGLVNQQHARAGFFSESCAFPWT